jgi:hypothetical protein
MKIQALVSCDEFLYDCSVEICRQSTEPVFKRLHLFIATHARAAPKTASSVWTSENHLEPGPDCRADPVFQVLSDKGRAPGPLFIVNVYAALTSDSFITSSPYTAVSWR